MAGSIENYVPLTIVERQKKQAVWVWGIGMAVALTWVAAIIAAPVSRSLAAESIAAPLYTFFSYICHQIPDRSFHYHTHQFAVCARCLGFYGGFLAGFVAYPFFRSFDSTDSFPRIWLFLALVPITIDFSLTVFGIWENSHWSRLITGTILGIACALFIIPALVEINNLLRMRGRRKNREQVRS